VGFPLARRASLMLVTLVGLLVGLTQTYLQQLLGAWNFTMAFRSASLSVLDVVYTAALRLPQQKRVRLTGAARTDLLVATCLAPLLYADLKAQPVPQLFATDASSLGGGCTVAAITNEELDFLYSIAEERGEHVRLDWDPAAEPPTELRDARAFAAPLACRLDWKILYGYRFKYRKHINLLELEALLTLMKHLVNRGIRDARVLVLVDSRVLLGALAKGRSSSRRINHVLKKISGRSLLSGIVFECVWIPTWANAADAPSRFTDLQSWRAKLPRLPPPRAGRLADGNATAELEQLRASWSPAAEKLQEMVDSMIAERRRRGAKWKRSPRPGRSKDAWRGELVYRAGDVERHPGPSRSRRATPKARFRRAGQPSGDSLELDVAPATAHAYETAL